MKKYFLLSFLATVLFALNGAAQTSLVGSKWLFSESKGKAITFDLTFEAGGKATYKQTNGPIAGAFTWSGTPDNLTIEGPFGSGSTLKMTGNITTGKLSYSSPWRSGGKSGTQTGEYNAKSDNWKFNDPALIGSKWYLSETKRAAIFMTLTFEAGGKATYKQTNGTNTGGFTWSGTSNNLTIEGPFGDGATIKMTGDITTGKLSYSSPWSSGGKSGTQTGEYRISKRADCTALNTNYLITSKKPAEQWTGGDKDTAIWLINTITGTMIGADGRNIQDLNPQLIKALLDKMQLCE